MGGGTEGQLPKTGERKQRKGKKRRVKEGGHESKAKHGKSVAKKKDNNYNVEEIKCPGRVDSEGPSVYLVSAPKNSCFFRSPGCIVRTRPSSLRKSPVGFRGS